jgi:hypothetical protein
LERKGLLFQKNNLKILTKDQVFSIFGKCLFLIHLELSIPKGELIKENIHQNKPEA